MNFSFYITLILLVNITAYTLAFIKFTNVKCDTLDPKFAIFKECRLKVLKRGIVALNIYAKVLQSPPNNITANVAMFKRANGYKPFLYNVTIDFCRFMKRRNQNLFLKLVADIISKSSNINHTCPYNHDIIISNFVLSNKILNLLPVPSGEYMYRFRMGVYTNWKVDVRSYFQIIEN